MSGIFFNIIKKLKINQGYLPLPIPSSTSYGNHITHHPDPVSARPPTPKRSLLKPDPLTHGLTPLLTTVGRWLHRLSALSLSLLSPSPIVKFLRLHRTAAPSVSSLSSFNRPTPLPSIFFPPATIRLLEADEDSRLPELNFCRVLVQE